MFTIWESVAFDFIMKHRMRVIWRPKELLTSFADISDGLVCILMWRSMWLFVTFVRGLAYLLKSLLACSTLSRFSERRWERVSTDMITQLPESTRGHNAIVVFVNGLTKMTHLVATTTKVTAVDYAHISWKRRIQSMACLKILCLTEVRDSLLTSLRSATLCKSSRICLLRSTTRLMVRLREWISM